MNFSTFSSNTYRNYVLWILVCTGGVIGILFAIGIYLQPLFGDLTRIGFYAERDFGWQGTQYVFADPRLQPDAPLDFHRNNQFQGLDILVIGDSFSRARPEYQWQNYLIAQNHLSVMTMDINQMDIRTVINSPSFLQHPPRVLIVESVERALPWRIKDIVPVCLVSPRHHAVVSLEMGQTVVKHPPIAVSRMVSWRLININFVMTFLERSFRWQQHEPSVYALPLSNPQLFSNRRSGTLLVYGDDVRKPEWKTQQMSSLNCRINTLQYLVERRGSTRFILMVAPDKMTAYAPWLVSGYLREHSDLLSRLSALHPAIMPRLDIAMRQSIKAGVRDVYFPDDTHWGWQGQQIAATTLIRFFNMNRQSH